MTYDPKEHEKYDKKKLPPEWYSKLENLFTHNKFWIVIILYILFFFVFPFFVDDSSDYDDPPSPYEFTSR